MLGASRGHDLADIKPLATLSGARALIGTAAATISASFAMRALHKASPGGEVDWVNSPLTDFGTPSDYCNLRVLENTRTFK
jgi:hypothetical protein